MSKSTEELKKQVRHASIWRQPWFYLVIVAVLVLVGLAAMQVPAVETRARNLYSRIYYRLNPPTENEFGPSQQGTISADVLATLTAMAPTATPEPTATDVQQAAVATEMPTPTNTPIPVPASFALDGMGLEYQTMNNCGPANLSMNVTYWGWTTNQHITEEALKTHKDDRNVMLQEMLDFVQANTNLKGQLRYGGDIEIIKRLLSGGFPVLLERGHSDEDDGWMGHYSIITAYDDTTQTVQIPDTLLGMMSMSYAELERDWWHFDGIYLVVYPAEREQEVLTMLGTDADPEQNLQNTLAKLEARIQQMSGQDLFFAVYSKGSVLVEMGDYLGAAQAYDQAFALYNQLDFGLRPWRITWYQVGPYLAYYYTGRYQDALNLADQTIANTSFPSLPETWYWGGQSALMLGDKVTAERYFRKALEFYPGWNLATQGLAQAES
ncbi:MAG: tetratricopeptide repeat protein [Anaerolineaceae bacterium]|jgi:tetratricopeptide (TPR) repeat protein|nr:tetratricopeptide repeat protein [Anaerolineaceae bacterium]